MHMKQTQYDQANMNKLDQTRTITINSDHNEYSHSE